MQPPCSPCQVVAIQSWKNSLHPSSWIIPTSEFEWKGCTLKRPITISQIGCSCTVLSYWFYFGGAECKGFWFPKVILNVLLRVCKFPVCFSFQTIKSMSFLSQTANTLKKSKLVRIFNLFFFVKGKYIS